jgi:DNA-binding response OmpR family regulator
VVRRYLEHAGHRVLMAGDGEEALRLIGDSHTDLVVLDIMLPGVDGIEVCRRTRRHSSVPIVMLTALGEEEDRVLGLRLGADDYVTKPFSPRELALRVESVLRRSRGGAPAASGELVDGDLRLDPVARTATRDGEALALTLREFDLLSFLMANRGTAFSRADLLDRVWGWNFGDQSTVTVHVRRLREKVEDDPARPIRIATVWGVGYRYDPRG